MRISGNEVFKNKKIELEKVIVDKKNNSWSFNLKSFDFITYEEYHNLKNYLNDKYIDDLVKLININIFYNLEYTKEFILDYYKNILKELINEYPRFNIFENYNVEYKDNTIYIYIDEEFNQNGYLKDFEERFLKYGINVNLEYKIDSTLNYYQEIEKEAINYFNQNLEENKSKEKVLIKEERFTKKSKEEITHIKEIPLNTYELNEYSNNIGRPFFRILGEVIKIEIRQNKSIILLMDVYDKTDTITIRQFVKEKDLDNLKTIKEGNKVEVYGEAIYDTYQKDILINAREIINRGEIEVKERMDNAEEKRVELHAITKMSNFESLVDVEDYFKTLKRWGHKAIAFTDINGVYAFPDINKQAKETGIKPIYGEKFSFVDDEKIKITLMDNKFPLKDQIYTVFDIETTGLSMTFDFIIEIAASKVQYGEIIDTFSSFVRPIKRIPKFIEEKTNITNEMVQNAPGIKEVLLKFKKFSNNTCLVGQNVNFDIGHIFQAYKNNNIEYNYTGIIDTLQIARNFYGNELKTFNLKSLTKYFKVSLENAHRAIDDSKATANIFIKMLKDLEKREILNYEDLNKSIDYNEIWKHVLPSYINVLVKNQKGYKDLINLNSKVLTEYIYKGPRLLKSVLNNYRENLLVGSSCYKGDVFETALNKSFDDLLEVIDYYDYIEIQPPIGYKHYVDFLFDDYDKNILEVLKKIVKACEIKNKIIVATGDVHYLNKEDIDYFKVLVKIKQVGGGLHDLARRSILPEKYLLTTNEMLEQFYFLGEEKAYEIVVKNTNLIADKIEDIVAFKDELYTPKDNFLDKKYHIKSVEESLKNMVLKNAHEIYGENLPLIVSKVLDKELNSIINNKFSTIYYMAHLLVKKSNDDGYIVGSRGSVGSSLVATMMKITEVNPLPPHYYCPKCHFSSFKMTNEEKEEYGIKEEEIELQKNLDKVESGFDLDDAFCPICHTKLKKDGQNIPFETFLGFSGDKVPDIDLNFAGEYQANAHNYVKEIMGEDKSFRSGTIGTIAEDTAIGYVKGYIEETNEIKRKPEIERISKKLIGVKRTTGQHPGGIVIVPDYIEVTDITPYQYPADDNTLSWRTTHFDYHKIESNLLKLDILGHDDPGVLRFIMDEVKKNPDKYPFKETKEIPVDDKNVYRLFNGTEVIGLKPSDIDSEVASYAVPELGTQFVRGLLLEMKPKNFADLVKVSGLSHGTDVWNNNSRDLVLGTIEEFGKIDISEIIGCRDDIMVYLIQKGLPPKTAFDIMEFVRRGKASKPGNEAKWEEYKKILNDYKIDKWYIWSCERIKYMFPKAHACAYVLNAIRIAWFKVYDPILFYSAYFSIRASYFDIDSMIKGREAVRKKINDITRELNDRTNYLTKGARKKEEDLQTVLYVALEMLCRGFKFLTPSIKESEAKKFIIKGNCLLMPFTTIPGLGDQVAFSFVEKRKTMKFETREDIKKNSGFNKTVLEIMDNLNMLQDYPEKEEIEEINLFTID